MKFRMKVEDLLRVGEATILTGKLHTQSNLIKNVSAVIEIDGKPAGELRIEGESRGRRLSPTPYRSLWTKSKISLTDETIRDHDVWLISRDDTPTVA